MAAKNGAGEEPAKAAERSAGAFGFILAMLVATVVGVVGGGIFGMYGIAATGTAARKPEKPDEQHGKPAYPRGLNLKMLAPIITNLGAPRNAWIRLEAAIVVDAATKDDDMLAAHIGEDIVTFLRTVSLTQIEGANGFQHLREDLTERVRMRSSGTVRELIIQSLVVE